MNANALLVCLEIKKTSTVLLRFCIYKMFNSRPLSCPLSEVEGSRRVLVSVGFSFKRTFYFYTNVISLFYI